MSNITARLIIVIFIALLCVTGPFGWLTISMISAVTLFIIILLNIGRCIYKKLRFRREKIKVQPNCNKPRFGRAMQWVAYLFLICLAIPSLWVMSKVIRMTPAGLNTGFYADFQPPEMAKAQYTPKDVIGDLGGMKVLIPKHYAEYVEYDGDPGFGKKRKGPKPERTFDSKLKSFGIEVRFPDMKGLESYKLWEEKRKQPLHEETWISIGINAGEIYPGDGFLDRITNSSLFQVDTPEFKGHWLFTYERMPADEYGLEFWRLTGINPQTNKPAWESYGNEDVYIHRNSSGSVDAYISCTHPGSVKSGVGRCDLSMSLMPKAQVSVSVSFRRGMLPEWREIQQSVRDLLLSFEVDPSSASTSVSQTTHSQMFQ